MGGVVFFCFFLGGVRVDVNAKVRSGWIGWI